jgi:hypothetical protein
MQRSPVSGRTQYRADSMQWPASGLTSLASIANIWFSSSRSFRLFRPLIKTTGRGILAYGGDWLKVDWRELCSKRAAARRDLRPGESGALVGGCLSGVGPEPDKRFRAATITAAIPRGARGRRSAGHSANYRGPVLVSAEAVRRVFDVGPRSFRLNSAPPE